MEVKNVVCMLKSGHSKALKCMYNMGQMYSPWGVNIKLLFCWDQTLWYLHSASSKKKRNICQSWSNMSKITSKLFSKANFTANHYQIWLHYAQSLQYCLTTCSGLVRFIEGHRPPKTQKYSLKIQKCRYHLKIKTS